jgi:hypothetical protein
MAFPNSSAGEYTDRLRAWGCLRLRLSDRKRLSVERSKVIQSAAVLGRRAYVSYRYPYLYARLGEPIPEVSSPRADVSTLLAPISHEAGPVFTHGIESERA